MTRKKRLCKGCEKFEEECLLNSNWNSGSRVTFLSEYPSISSIRGNSPFRGDNGTLLRKLISSVTSAVSLDQYHSDGGFRYSAAYVTKALGSTSSKPSKEVINKCRKLWEVEFLNQFGSANDGHVLVALGNIALKSIGIKANKIEAVRGRVFKHKIGNKEVKVVPTFSLQHMRAKPGVIKLAQKDILKALKEAYGLNKIRAKPIEELAKDYVYPQTIEEVKDICDHIIAYTQPEKVENPDDWTISVDIETNTLRPFKPGAKTLMISFAWDDGKATAIILDHASAPYNPKEAWEHVARVLECPKPKSFHNAKFDISFLENLNGCEVNNYVYDTLLAEHFLDEDRAGNYSLKILCPIYCPDYEGYEELLQKELRENDQLYDFQLDQKDADFYYEATKPQITFEDEWLSDLEESEEDPNLKYLFPLPEEVVEKADPKLLQAYENSRNLWFFYDAHRKSKARSESLKLWRKAAKQLGLETPKPKATTRKIKQDKGFEEIDLTTLLPYAAADADITRLIHKKQKRLAHRRKLLKDLLYVMDTVYVPASLALSQMEFLGVRIDYEKLDRFISQSAALAEEAKEKIFKYTCRDFNPAAGQQLGPVLEECGIEILARTETTNEPKTDKETLLKLQELYASKSFENQIDEDRDATGKLTDLGKLNLIESILLFKESSNFISKFGRGIKKLSALDGRIHTSFLLHGTATGRLSSSKLNLQNLPKYMVRLTRPNFENPDEPIVLCKGFNVKSILIPDRENQLFFNMDISAAEIRVLAFYSGDQNLIKAINAGADIHLIFLTKIKHKELEPDLDNPEFREKYDHYLELKEAGDPDLEEFRRSVKTVVFATIYGSGPSGIANSLGDTSDAGKQFAFDLQQSLFKAFPSVEKYIRSTHQELFTRAEVKTKLGRRRRFWMISVSNKHRGDAKRQAVNFKIQSTASDLLVAQFYNIVTQIHKIGGSCRLTVHDSVSGVIPKENAHLLQPFFHEHIVEGVRNKFPWMPVEYKIDLEVGENYGEVLPLEKYLEEQKNLEN